MYEIYSLVPISSYICIEEVSGVILADCLSKSH